MKLGSLAGSKDGGELFLRARPEDGSLPLSCFTLHSQDHVPRSCVLAVNGKRDEAVPVERPERVTETGPIHHHAAGKFSHGWHTLSASRQFSEEAVLRDRQSRRRKSCVVKLSYST